MGKTTGAMEATTGRLAKAKLPKLQSELRLSISPSDAGSNSIFEARPQTEFKVKSSNVAKPQPQVGLPSAPELQYQPELKPQDKLPTGPKAVSKALSTDVKAPSQSKLSTAPELKQEKPQNERKTKPVTKPKSKPGPVPEPKIDPKALAESVDRVETSAPGGASKKDLELLNEAAFTRDGILRDANAWSVLSKYNIDTDLKLGKESSLEDLLGVFSKARSDVKDPDGRYLMTLKAWKNSDGRQAAGAARKAKEAKAAAETNVAKAKAKQAATDRAEGKPVVVEEVDPKPPSSDEELTAEREETARADFEQTVQNLEDVVSHRIRDRR